MRIQHNIMAMNAYRNYNNNTKALSKNLERLSSGYKINRAGDDAAGLAISEKMRAQITGLEAAQKNVKDGISLVNTAEGAMQEIHDMLNRMVYLATQSANGTYDNEVDRANLQKEVDSLKEEINRIADSANFNGIKLLDGSLDADGTASITTQAVDYVDHAAIKGITVGDVEDGGGSNGTYTINIDEIFGTGDTIKFTWGNGSGFVSSASATADNPASEGEANTTALTGNSTTLTFDKDNEALTSLAAGTFTGTTREEQAKSIAYVLSQDANISAQFNVEAQGDKVILTNINEGNDQATVSKVETLDTAGAATKQAKLGTPTTTPAAANIATGTDFTFEDIVNNENGMELQEGDTLTIKLTDAQGVDWTAKVTLTQELMKGSNGNTANAIVAALNKTDDKEAIYFEANDKTARAEEKIKFSDLFTASLQNNTSNSNAPNADLKLAAKNTNDIFQDGKAGKITSDRAGVNASSATSANASTTGGAAAVYSIDLDATGDGNYSRGDKLTIEGKLSDGRDFSFDLIAGEHFEVGATKNDTVTNIVNYLTTSKDTIEVKDEDENVESVALKDIFNGSTDKEIQVANSSGALKFTSQVKGTDFNGQVTDVKLVAAKAGAVSPDLRNGVQKTAATSSITFDSELELGATATVNGKTYQFVKDAADVEDGNTAIVISDPTDSAAVAQAFADQLTEDAGTNSPEYTVKVTGSTVNITTTAKGQDVKAITIEGAGASHKDAVFQLQPNKMKTGSTITVNGKTFEFVDTKDSTAELSNADNIRVDVDLTKGDTVEINQALKDAIEAAGIAGIEEINIDDEGTLRICGDGTIDPTITFENGKPLTLQIGDTSDNYNQLKVKVSDMHTWAMGIADIDISNQEGAQAAIDVIRNAINYVSSTRGDLGAVSNRLDHTANNLSVMAENIQDAESTIRDTDVAEEMMAYTKNNILVQSAQAMLAQANQVPQGVLQLLQ